MIKFLFYNKKMFIIIICLLLIIGVVESSLIIYIDYLVKYLVNNPNIKKLYIYALVGLGIAASIHSFNYLSSRIIINYTVDISHLVRKDFVKKLLNSPLFKLNEHGTSYYISFILNDIPKLLSLNEVILSLISNIIYFIFTFSILTVLNWKISLLALCCLVVHIIPLFACFKKINSNNIKISNQYASYTSVVKEYLSELEIVKTNLCEDYSYKRICDVQDELKNIEINSYFTNNRQRTSIHFISALTYLSLILLASYLILRGELGISIISVLVYCSNLLTNLALSLFGKANLIITSKSLRNKYNQITKDYKYVDGTNNISKINKIEFKNISFSYKERPVLKNINITFEKNKKYLIIGKSGAGKTTLFNLLINAIRKYDGHILIDGSDFTEVYKESIYKNIVYVKQKPYVFSQSIRNNIIMNNPFDNKMYNKSIEIADLKPFLSTLQFGDNELISEEIDKVSEGEKQRISIARGLYKKGSVYLFDEINASLDKHSSEKIEHNILNIKGAIVINIAHKFSQSLISMYDKILLIEDGEIVFAKPYSQIKHNPKFIFYKERLENENN